MAVIWILAGYNPVGRGVPNSFGHKVLGYAIVAASLFGIGPAIAANRRKERWYPVTYVGLLLSGWFLYIYLPLTPKPSSRGWSYWGFGLTNLRPLRTFSCTNRGGGLKRQPISPA